MQIHAWMCHLQVWISVWASLPNRAEYRPAKFKVAIFPPRIWASKRSTIPSHSVTAMEGTYEYTKGNELINFTLSPKVRNENRAMHHAEPQRSWCWKARPPWFRHCQAAHHRSRNFVEANIHNRGSFELLNDSYHNKERSRRVCRLVAAGTSSKTCLTQPDSIDASNRHLLCKAQTDGSIYISWLPQEF